MAQPGPSPRPPDTNVATLRGVRTVTLAAVLTLAALVIDARLRPPPAEPVALLPVPPAPASPARPGAAPSAPAPAAPPGEAAAKPAPEPAPAPSAAASGTAEPAPAPAPDPLAAPATSGVPPPLSLAPAASAAGSVRDGVLAYQAGDYARAHAIWKPLAEAGNARARFHLGALYLEGRLGPPDFEAAYRWLALAAEAGQSAALPLRERAAASLSAERLAAIRTELGLPP